MDLDETSDKVLDACPRIQRTKIVDDLIATKTVTKKLIDEGRETRERKADSQR